MKHYLYRVRITEYPEGALMPCDYDPDWLIPNRDWREGRHSAVDRDRLARRRSRRLVTPTEENPHPQEQVRARAIPTERNTQCPIVHSQEATR